MVQFTLFLLIGILLFVYYGDAHLAPPAQLDRLYPVFIWNNLPVGVAGLVIAAILAAAMANLSAALNALSSTTVVDFLHGAARVKLALAACDRGLGFGRCWRSAFALRHSQSVLEAGLSIASIPARRAAGRLSAGGAYQEAAASGGDGGCGGRTGRHPFVYASRHPSRGPGMC